MNNILLLSLAIATCAPPRLIGFKGPLTDRDKEAMEVAEKQCKEVENDCVKVIYKNNKAYTYVCGKL